MRKERTEQAESMRERIRNMSPEEREKFRAQMSDRYGPRSRGLGYEEQLKSIRVIEEQVARLKAALQVTTPENRYRLRNLPQKERTKLREKMMAAMRDRQMAIRNIEQELRKLRGPVRQITDSNMRISELRSIHKLAVEEKATRTAERLERLIASYERESRSRVRPSVQGAREGELRQRRERPTRQEDNQ